MRITLVVHNLDCGGVQHVAAIQANYWAKKGWKVTLVALDDDSVPPYF